MKKGQTLVVLLVFVAISMTVILAAISAVINSTASGGQYETGQSAYFLAETGAEEAMLRLLRDPSFVGETLTTADGIATITVTGGIGPKTIISTATIGSITRKIQVVAGDVNGVLTVTSWKEI